MRGIDNLPLKIKQVQFCDFTDFSFSTRIKRNLKFLAAIRKIAEAIIERNYYLKQHAKELSGIDYSSFKLVAEEKALQLWKV